MSATISTLLLIILTCLCFALAAFVASAEGHSWWRTDDGTTKIDIGLWKTCSKKLTEDEICTRFSNILEFTKDRIDFDVVLLLLILAGISVFIALPSAFSLFCCQKYPGRRKCVSRQITVASLIGAVVGFIALGYAEIQFEEDWDSASHGWSAILAWIGSASSLLSFILSAIMLYLMSTTGLPKESFRMNRKCIPTRQTYPINDDNMQKY